MTAFGDWRGKRRTALGGNKRQRLEAECPEDAEKIGKQGCLKHHLCFFSNQMQDAAGDVSDCELRRARLLHQGTKQADVPDHRCRILEPRPPENCSKHLSCPLSNLQLPVVVPASAGPCCSQSSELCTTCFPNTRTATPIPSISSHNFTAFVQV